MNLILRDLKEQWENFKKYFQLKKGIQIFQYGCFPDRDFYVMILNGGKK